MGFRVIVNGREYTRAEDLPDGVRQALAELADADRNGVPDVLERGDATVVSVHHSSLTVNGRTYNDADEMPPAVRRMFDQAMAFAAAPGRPTPLHDPAGPNRQMLATLDRLDDVLTRVLRILLVGVAVAILAGAAFLMTQLDAGSRSQGGRWFVAVAALVALGAVDSRYAWLRRRELLTLTETPGYRRYRVRSLLLLVAAAGFLFGCAFLLP